MKILYKLDTREISAFENTIDNKIFEYKLLEVGNIKLLKKHEGKGNF